MFSIGYLEALIGLSIFILISCACFVWGAYATAISFKIQSDRIKNWIFAAALGAVSFLLGFVVSAWQDEWTNRLTLNDPSASLIIVAASAIATGVVTLFALVAAQDISHRKIDELNNVLSESLLSTQQYIEGFPINVRPVDDFKVEIPVLPHIDMVYRQPLNLRKRIGSAASNLVRIFRPKGSNSVQNASSKRRANIYIAAAKLVKSANEEILTIALPVMDENSAFHFLDHDDRQKYFEALLQKVDEAKRNTRFRYRRLVQLPPKVVERLKNNPTDNSGVKEYLSFPTREYLLHTLLEIEKQLDVQERVKLRIIVNQRLTAITIIDKQYLIFWLHGFDVKGKYPYVASSLILKDKKNGNLVTRYRAYFESLFNDEICLDLIKQHIPIDKS